MFSKKILKKSHKKVISRKLQRIGRSDLEARFGILESTLAEPKYRVGKFSFCEKNNNLSFLNIFEKITKNVISRKLQGLNSHIWRQDLQLLGVP